MITALTVDEAERIRDMGDAAKCTYSDRLAGLIRIGLNHLDELPPKLLPKEELDLAPKQEEEKKELDLAESA
jgi:hypothetical protein